MKDQLIGIKTAKLAKEKGFKEYCRRLYVLEEQDSNDDIGKIHYRTETYFSNSNYTNREFVSAPTQSLLQKWLREVHKIYVQPFYDEPEWRVAICDPNENQLGDYEQQADMTYEEALELGLQEALKLIINAS